MLSEEDLGRIRDGLRKVPALARQARTDIEAVPAARRTFPQEKLLQFIVMMESSFDRIDALEIPDLCMLCLLSTDLAQEGYLWGERGAP